MGAWVTPWEHATPSHVIAPNSVAIGQTVWAWVGVPNFFWDAGTPPLEVGARLAPWKHALVQCVLPYTKLGQTVLA